MTTAVTRRWSAKRAIKQAIRPLHSSWATRSRLAGAASQLGVRRGGIVLVHSSLSALGFVPGGAETVVAAMLDAVGPSGTVVMPTHTWEWMDQGERTFDVRATPSCVGIITEQFRKLPHAIRSLHPTHSVAAIGPMAAELMADHQKAASPCGEGTPYMRILEQGQVLLLGVGLQYNTVFHTIEAMTQAPYLLSDVADQFTILDEDGSSTFVSIRRHRLQVRRNFPGVEDLLVRSETLVKGMVGRSVLRLINGRRFLDCMLPAIRSDPSLLRA